MPPKTKKETVQKAPQWTLNSKEEFTTMYEVFQLAKETKKQSRERVKSIQEYYEENNE